MQNTFELNGKKLNLLKHNQHDIYDYHSNEFDMAPYPVFKRPIFNDDNITTANRPYFLMDDKFKQALTSAEARWTAENSIGSNQKRDICWRLHILLSFVEKIFEPNNDPVIVEFGTGMGYMAFGIASYFKEKKLSGFLYDTFSPGLPGFNNQKAENPNSYIGYAKGEENYPIELSNDLAKLSKNHSWNVIQGMLPGTINPTTWNERQISFLHVDLNSSNSEELCLALILPYINHKTLIIFDDTGAPGSEAQHEVHSSFAKQLGKKLIYMPTGQSIIF